MYNKFSFIYDNLMKTQVDYEKICKNILNICLKYNLNVKTVLECAMGSGNLTEVFLSENLEVDGFDISDDMLSIAYNKLIAFKNVNILKGDVRYFNSGKTYDLICCFFDVINYLKNLSDIELFLCNSYKQMNENSILMFDINSKYKLKQYLGNNDFIVEENGIFYTWRNELNDKYIDFNIDFFAKTDNNMYERIVEKQRQYIYEESEIEKVIENKNFKILEKIDFETFEKSNENSFRILYVLTKQK